MLMLYTHYFIYHYNIGMKETLLPPLFNEETEA